MKFLNVGTIIAARASARVPPNIPAITAVMKGNNNSDDKPTPKSRASKAAAIERNGPISCCERASAAAPRVSSIMTTDGASA